MKKIPVILIILILSLTSVFAGLIAEYETIDDSIYLDEVAQYKLSVTNTDLYEKTLKFKTSSYRWYLEFEPSNKKISGATKNEYILNLIPGVWAKPGSEYISISIQDIAENDLAVINIPVFVKSYDETPKQYSPSVELNVEFPNNIDPRVDTPIEIHLRNRNKLDITQLNITIQSKNFHKSTSVYLGPLEEHDLRILYKVEDITTPGTDQLKISLSIGNKTFSAKKLDYELLEYSDFIVDEDRISELFRQETHFTVINKGNVPKVDSFRVKTTLFERLFTDANPEPDSVDLKNQVMVWNLELNPLDEFEIKVTKNYRPTIYILLISIIVLMMYFIYRSPITINKETIVVDASSEGITELKVLLHLRNRSPDLIENVTVTDLIPSIATFKKTTLIGTIKPSKVLQHQKKGTIVKWDFDAVEPFEERIISYRIHTKITIVGGLTLPFSKIKFLTKKGTEKIYKSNKSKVSLGL